MPDLESIAIPVRKKVLKLTIQNTQSVATANPHYQEIKLDHYQLLSILGASIDPYAIPLNTIFYDPQAGAQAYSQYDFFDGTSHRWFVKTQSIGANSTYTLYMIIDLEEMLIDGNIAGIDAYYGQYYLGLAYGQYDNGKNMFLFYDNFQGTSLASYWSYGGSITLSVNNGLTVTQSANTTWAGMYTSFTSSPSSGPKVWTRFIPAQLGGSYGDDYAMWFGYGESNPANGPASTGYMSDWYGGGDGGVTIGKLTYGYFTWWYSGGTSYLYSYESNKGTYSSSTSTSYNPSQIQQFGWFTYASNSTNVYIIYKFAVMDAPPFNVNPSITSITPLN
jgi:hypothetical protein